MQSLLRTHLGPTRSPRPPFFPTAQMKKTRTCFVSSFATPTRQWRTAVKPPVGHQQFVPSLFPLTSSPQPLPSCLALQLMTSASYPFFLLHTHIKLLEALILSLSFPYPNVSGFRSTLLAVLTILCSGPPGLLLYDCSLCPLTPVHNQPPPDSAPSTPPPCGPTFQHMDLCWYPHHSDGYIFCLNRRSFLLRRQSCLLYFNVSCQTAFKEKKATVYQILNLQIHRTP
ncbi:uncharacterized protein LOC110344880 [Heterocephalus glaber]|uniref:Uncharacterized protein LOC110344880 n=1 Tax=Heterocephalus glaber TaxID=10181 RepID=A0AAX6RJG8_HETGA|nr:uncharacterized protein LOC110344880 [Heterocephalus glaber]